MIVYQRYFILLFLFAVFNLKAQQVAVLKYSGGGDWYANPTAVPNLIKFCNENINTKINLKPKTVLPDSQDIFLYPIVFMTGHGHVEFSDNDVENLKNYLKGGGFLHISDNYGLDQYIRKEMKKVFPNSNFVEVPYTHNIYHQTFDFNTLPKIHEHNNNPPKGYAIFVNDKMVCFYDYESDLSDGWENAEIHHNPLKTRLKALQMGANIVEYAFKQ